MSLDVKRNKSDTKEHILILSEGQVIQMAEEETNSTPNSKSVPFPFSLQVTRAVITMLQCTGPTAQQHPVSHSAPRCGLQSFLRSEVALTASCSWPCHSPQNSKCQSLRVHA